MTKSEQRPGKDLAVRYNEKRQKWEVYDKRRPGQSQLSSDTEEGALNWMRYIQCYPFGYKGAESDLELESF
jgi:hypothetical protein